MRQECASRLHWAGLGFIGQLYWAALGFIGQNQREREAPQDEGASPLLPGVLHRQLPPLAKIGRQAVVLQPQQLLHQLLHLLAPRAMSARRRVPHVANIGMHLEGLCCSYCCMKSLLMRPCHPKPSPYALPAYLA